MGRRLKKALENVGHGKIHKRKVRPGQDTITIKGKDKNVSPGKRRGGCVYWYKRSDNGVALRNFKLDRAKKADRRAIRKKGYTGD